MIDIVDDDFNLIIVPSGIVGKKVAALAVAEYPRQVALAFLDQIECDVLFDVSSGCHGITRAVRRDEWQEQPHPAFCDDECQR